MMLQELASGVGEWLRGEGPQSDIVVSSRVRLARNLSGFHFHTRMDPMARKRVSHTLRDTIHALYGDAMHYFAVDELAPLDQRLLVERHLISREHEKNKGVRGVAIDAAESISLMVNEEDHIRLQALRSGLRLQEAFDSALQMDDALGGVLDFAFDEEFGYLTACPTNVGTGMRVSVMLHLPALGLTRHAEKAFNAVHDLRLAMRGLYGEGSEASGDLYQISNQITIGVTEEKILADLQHVIDGLIHYEREARQLLEERDKPKLEDRVWRAFGTLRHARLITTEEALRLLSAVRMGVGMGLMPGFSIRTLNRLFILSQPAHLQYLEGGELEQQERDIARARFIRNELTQYD